MRILLAEDEEKMARAIAEALSQEGHEVVSARNGREALDAVDAGPEYHLVLLDWMMPELDGIEVLRTLRGRDSGVPILLLTARDSIEDRVEGLDAGADDYLVKPFAIPELCARVRALARRGRSDPEHRLAVGDIEVEVLRRRVTRAGQPIELTGKEFEVLQLLVENAGQTVSREMLARVVWRGVPRATPLDNVIDVHIARLRRKLDDAFDKKCIRTVRGVGFVLDA